MLHDITRPMLLEILIQNGVPYKEKKSEESIYLPEPNHTIMMRSADDPTKLIGRNLSWFGVDEASYIVEDSWRRLEARVRDPKAKKLCGFGVWTPNGLNWIWKRFLSDEKVDGYELVLARPGENRAVLMKTPDYYERLKASYDERFYKQEVLGEYLELFGGQVYYAYSEGCKRAGVYQWNLPICWSLDFNLNPYCSVIAQVIRDPYGRAYAVQVLDEIAIPGSDTSEMTEVFIERATHYLRVRADKRLRVQIYGDPAGNTEHTNAHDTDYDIIRKIFRRHPEFDVSFHVETHAPLVRQRTTLVNGLLTSADDQHHLFIDPKCRELIADMREVAWKTDTLGNPTPALSKKNPKRTHMSDALGYLCWTEFQTQQETGWGRDLLF
jgi:hypothetical protein